MWSLYRSKNEGLDSHLGYQTGQFITRTHPLTDQQREIRVPLSWKSRCLNMPMFLQSAGHIMAQSSSCYQSHPTALEGMISQVCTGRWANWMSSPGPRSLNPNIPHTRYLPPSTRHARS